MSKLIAVISPAKLLDESLHFPKLQHTLPDFLPQAKSLMEVLKKKTPKQIGEMMELSEKLSIENFDRNQVWNDQFSVENATQAILLFKGDVYRGLKAEELTVNQLKWAQDHVRILSGLYGILRPMDLTKAYRLMMGTPFSPSKTHKNLYSFWNTQLAENIKRDLDPKGTLVNLASSEYFKAIDQKTLDRKIITCEFKERKGEKLSIVSTYAKLARGKMARFIIDHKIDKPTNLKDFDVDGYRFEKSVSTENELVFVR
jgi:uncharacterized protein